MYIHIHSPLHIHTHTHREGSLWVPPTILPMMVSKEMGGVYCSPSIPILLLTYWLPAKSAEKSRCEFYLPISTTHAFVCSLYMHISIYILLCVVMMNFCHVFHTTINTRCHACHSSTRWFTVCQLSYTSGVATPGIPHQKPDVLTLRFLPLISVSFLADSTVTAPRFTYSFYCLCPSIALIENGLH